MTHFSFMQGLASPERTIDHRQAVKRSGTPAVCRQVTECQRYDRLSDRHICHPLRGSVIDCVISRGSVLCTPPPACVLSCLRHLSFRMSCSTLFFTFHSSLSTLHASLSTLHASLFLASLSTLHASRFIIFRTSIAVAVVSPRDGYGGFGRERCRWWSD